MITTALDDENIRAHRGTIHIPTIHTTIHNTYYYNAFYSNLPYIKISGRPDSVRHNCHIRTAWSVFWKKKTLQDTYVLFIIDMNKDIIAGHSNKVSIRWFKAR